MKILFVTIAWPQMGGSNIYSDLLEEFKRNGHEVFVAYADEKNDITSLKVENGIKVLRFSTLKIRKAGKLKKALSLLFLGQKFKRNINKYYSEEGFDLIIGHTPPITLSGLMIYLKKNYNAFFYLLLKDIWPHHSVDLGVIKKNGLVYHFFRWHEKRIYKAADWIGCMSPKNVEYILKHNPYLDSAKVEECPNSITLRDLSKINHSKIRSKYGIPENATVFILSGNMELSHGYEFYIDVIEELRDYKKAYFLIGGSGRQYNYVSETIKERRLPNVLVYRWLPKNDFMKVLLGSNVGVIILSSKNKSPQFPSRLLGYLEASKPVLCIVNKETDIGSIVENAGCGIFVRHGDKESVICEIKRLSENSSLHPQLTGNARKLLKSRYSVQGSYSIIMSHFN